MIDIKLPRNMEYIGREKREDKYETKQKPLGVVMDKNTGEQYVILNRLGTMMSYKKYYK
jgi:hypothetical protein